MVPRSQNMDNSESWDEKESKGIGKAENQEARNSEEAFSHLKS